MTGPEWRERAACRDVDPELFFPEMARVDVAQVRAAKAVCAGCAVRTQCLEFALEWLPEGIAGGLTPSERWALGGAGRGPHRAAHCRVRAASSVESVLRQERRTQALLLRRCGHSAPMISARLGMSTRQVERWLAVAG